MSLGQTYLNLHMHDSIHIDEKECRSLEEIKLDIEQHKRKEETKSYVKKGKYSYFNVYNCY